MPSVPGSAVGWLVLSPLALLTNVMAVVVVCHYRKQFHGTDVAFISLFVSMATQALLVVPIPAALQIHGQGWLVSQFCSFYVWLTVCLRMSELLVTCVMNIHWMCILRFTSGQEVYSSATVVKVVVVVAWFGALVTGLVPVVGTAFYTFYSETVTQEITHVSFDSTPQLTLSTTILGECRWLPGGLGTSFVLFFILVTLTAFILSLVASADTLLVFYYMRKTAVHKYKAGRFYLPPSSMVGSAPTADLPAGRSGQNTGGAAVLLRGEAERRRHSLPPAPLPPMMVREEEEGEVEEESEFGFRSARGEEEDGEKSVEDEFGFRNQRVNSSTREAQRGSLQRRSAAERSVGEEDVGVFVVSHNNGGLPGTSHNSYQQPQPLQTSQNTPSRRTSNTGAYNSATATPRRQSNSTGVIGRGASASGGASASVVGPSVRAGVPRRPAPASSAAAVVVRPSAKSGVAHNSSQTVHARYNELSLSSELCRVVLFFTCLTALLHHMPFVVLQFVQLVDAVDQHTAETVVLWLTLAHSLLAPHVLWMLSRRYRHALRYTWRVHVLRDDTAKEEDPAACTLQSYTRRVRTADGGTVKVTARVRGRVPVSMATHHGNRIVEGQPNGSAIPLEDSSLARPGCNVTEARANGRLVVGDVTTDLDDGMAVMTGASVKASSNYDQPCSDDSPCGDTGVSHAGKDLHEDEASQPADTDRTQSPDCEESAGSSSKSSYETAPCSPSKSSSPEKASLNKPSPAKSTTSSSKSSLGTPTKQGSTEIRRSSSARKVWKEQMMKKHLPAVFINEAFESDEVCETVEPVVVEEINVKTTPVVVVGKEEKDQAARKSPSTYDVPRGSSSAAKGGPFHYYMYGDFHHDLLRGDSLPRFESESEGGSFQYDDNDIEGILDHNHSSRFDRDPLTSSTSTFFAHPQRTGDTHGSHMLTVLKPAGESRPPSAQKTTSDSRPASAARSSSVNSESRSEGSESSLGRRGRKGPLIGTSALLQAARPSLQHQKTVHTDLEGGEGHIEPNQGDNEGKLSANNTTPVTEPLADSESVQTKQNITAGGSDSMQTGFYPVFHTLDSVESSGGITEEQPATSTDPSSVSAGARTNESEESSEEITNENEVEESGTDMTDTLTSDNDIDRPYEELEESVADSVEHRTSQDDFEDADDIDTTLPTSYPAATQRSARGSVQSNASDILDTGDVIVSIDHVTRDATFTDDLLGDAQYPHGDSLQGAVHGDMFTPQTQDSVMGILMKSDHDLVPETPQYDDTLHVTPNFHRNNNASNNDFTNGEAANTEDDSPDHVSAAQRTSPFRTSSYLNDLPGVFETDYPTHAEAFPTHSANTETNSSQSVLEGVNDGGGYDAAETRSNSSETGKKEMITRVGSDVTLPDKTGVVLDIEETSSSTASEPSVTLEPYGDRRPPWLDDFDEDVSPRNGPFSSSPYDTTRSSEDSDTFGSSGDFGSSFGSNAELGTIFGNSSKTPTKTDLTNPFVFDTFTENSARPRTREMLGSCSSDDGLLNVQGYPANHQGYPVFDDETERGFEDALSLEYVVGNPYYGNFGRFESIEEEPEDLTESASSTLKSEDGLQEFRTTVVSRPSSRCSTSTPVPGEHPDGAVLYAGLNGSFLVPPPQLPASSIPSSPKSIHSLGTDDPFLSEPLNSFSINSTNTFGSDEPSTNSTQVSSTKWSRFSEDNAEPFGNSQDSADPFTNSADIEVFKTSPKSEKFRTENSAESVGHFDGGLERGSHKRTSRMSGKQGADLSSKDSTVDPFADNLKQTSHHSTDSFSLNANTTPNGDMYPDISTNGTSSELSTPSSRPKVPPKPTVRLTKPHPWPSLDDKSDSIGFESDFDGLCGKEEDVDNLHTKGDGVNGENGAANGESEFDPVHPVYF